MEKFLMKLSVYLMFPVLIISVNYFADPANLFHEDYESSIANNLMKGYNVTNVYNHNERLLQKKLIKNNPLCPEEIALGSSRGMLLNKFISQSPSFFNNSMSGSVLEDNIAIYELYEQRGCPIKLVIISLDPWILNDNHGEKRWKSLEPEYNSFLSKLYKERETEGFIFFNNYENYKQLLSFSYFKSSVRYLIKGIGRKDAKATRLAENNGLTRITDGSVTWDAQYRDAPQAVVDRRANDIIAVDPMEYLGRFDHLSVHYKNLLINFVSYLQRKQIKVEFLLTPFHPVVYSNFMQKKHYRNVLASEEFFKTLARDKGIEIYGSFDPRKTDLVSSDFYDGLHCTADGLVKIMNTRMINRSKPIKKEIL
ncbi:MAG TPA: hypothetical protein VGD31_14065 [Sphingobacteriaceae bacterium]